MSVASIPSVLNLASVAESQRAATWSRSAGMFFPGLSVTRQPVNPAGGSIHGISFGAGKLWTIQSPQVLVSYHPTLHDEGLQLFSVMLQLEGSTAVRQGDKRSRLESGEFCMLDEESPFELEVTEPLSRVMFLQMPRHAVLNRHAGLEHHTAIPFSAREPGAALLRNVLLNVFETGPQLFEEQRSAALAAVMQLVGVPALQDARADVSRTAGHIHSVLAFIDAELSDPTLNAQRVADSHGLSRRRLDQILLERLGSSLSAQIWLRRLNQAASDLLDPRFETRTVTQIAFSVGFEDAAHFARAFKRRYGCTAREWRQKADASSGARRSLPRLAQ